MTVMPSSSDVADKAVSTEDASCGVEVASIDALLAALVETKVEAMKASSSSTMTRRFVSVPASPKRPRLTSSSTASSSLNHHHLHHCHGDHHHHGEHLHHGEQHYGDHLEHLHEHYRDRHHGEHPGDLHEELEDQGNYYFDHCQECQDKDHHHGKRHLHSRKYEKRKRDRHRRHGSAPCGEFIENPKLYEHHAHRCEKGKRRASECPRSPRKKKHSKSPHILQEDILDLPLGLDAPFELLGIDGDQEMGLLNLSRSKEAFSDICEYPRLHQSACYTSQSETQLKIHYDEDDDFLALNLEDELDDEETLSCPQKMVDPVEKFHHPRKKRKRRRRKVETEIVQIEREFTDPDDLPPRARLTIVATACLLLVMSLLLVGITLRMAPIIDEMVRKENEALMNSLNRDSSVPANSTASP